MSVGPADAAAPHIPPQPPPEVDQRPHVGGPEEAGGAQPVGAPAGQQPAQAPQGPQDTYEAASAEQAPVDLTGGEPQAAAWQPMAAQDPGAVSASDFAEDPEPVAQANGTGAAAPVQAVGDANPADRADPAKMGAALNGPPENWPPAEKLTEAGITGVRVTMQGGANYTEANKGDWQTKLQEYKNAGIDVTLNVPIEASGTPMPAVPQSLWDNVKPPPAEDPGMGQPHNLIPFTREGTSADGRELTPEQQADARQWYQDFDAWAQNSYLPTLRDAQATLGDSVSRYEIWNEPDEPHNTNYYNPGLPAPAFGEVLQKSYETIKPGVDPDSPEAKEGPQIVSGGLDSGLTSYLDQAIGASGGKLYADAVAVHPYTKEPAANSGMEGPWTGTLESIANEYSRFGKPISFTELGDKRGGNEQYIERSATAVTNLPQVDRGYFFWEHPYDGKFGLHTRPEGTTGWEALVPEASLSELTRRTHLPPPEAAPAE